MIDKELQAMAERGETYESFINTAYDDISNATKLGFYINWKEPELREFWEPILKLIQIGGNTKFSIDFLREMKDNIKWELLANQIIFEDKVMKEFWDKIDWIYVIYNYKMTEEQMEFYIEKVVLDQHNNQSFYAPLCTHQTLSEQFIEKHFNIFKNCLELICQYQTLSEEFIERHKDEFDWRDVSSFQDMSEDFMFKMERYINWDIIHETKELSPHSVMKIYNEFMNNKNYRWINKFNKITENFIIRYWDRFKWDWDAIMPVVKFSEDFIIDYGDEIDRWDLICETQEMSEELIEELIEQNKFNFNLYILHAQVSEDFLRRHFEKFDPKTFSCITVSQVLSESFLREFKDYLDVGTSMYVKDNDINFMREWRDRISFKSPLFNQKIDQRTIVEFADKLDWDWVSERQTLSEDMIIRYSERVTWARLDRYQNLSKEFLEEHFDKIFVEEEDI